MNQTLHQLGGLLLGAVPTVILLALLFGLYSVILHNPLAKVLAQRHGQTEGAVEQARADVAQAEAKTAEYEQRIREARLAVFKSQEARRQQALQARATAVAAARSQAQRQVKEARAVLDQEKVSAQDGLQQEVSKLATSIIESVLRPAAPTQAGGAR